MKQKRKEFIKRAHKAACEDWQLEIEKEFSELFIKPKFEVGKWYKISNEEGYLLNYSGDRDKNYGLMNGKYSESYSFWNYHIKNSKPATNQEVEKALIKEAKKRGIKPENHKCLVDGNIWTDNIGGKYDYCGEGLMIGASWCFYKGKWAEIITKETITKAEAEKKLGVSIIC